MPTEGRRARKQFNKISNTQHRQFTSVFEHKCVKSEPRFCVMFNVQKIMRRSLFRTTRSSKDWPGICSVRFPDEANRLFTEYKENRDMVHGLGSHYFITYPVQIRDSRRQTTIITRENGPSKVGRPTCIDITSFETVTSRWLALNSNITYAHKFKTHDTSKLAIESLARSNDLLWRQTNDSKAKMRHRVFLCPRL